MTLIDRLRMDKFEVEHIENKAKVDFGKRPRKFIKEGKNKKRKKLMAGG